MATFFHNATGIANGVAITAANSGTYPDTAYPSSSGIGSANTGTVTASTSTPLYGGSSQRELFSCGSGQLAYVEDGVVAVAPGTADKYSEIIDFGGGSAPGAVTTIHSWRNSAGEVCRLTCDTGGILRLYVGATFTGGTQVWTSTAAVVAGDRLYCAVQPGTSTSNGSAAVTIFTGNTATARTGGTYASAAINTGTTNLTGSRRGVVQAAASTIGMTQVQHITGAAVSDPGVWTPPGNAAPTVTGGATITMNTGSTATAVFTADDTDGTISSFQAPTVTSTADTAPTVGTPTLSGIGSSHATASYPINGLTPSDTTISTRPVDNAGAPAAAVASVRIIYTSTAPKAKAVTLVDCTMTSPSSGTPKDAWNAWLTNPYNASTNPTGVQPPQFTTAGPPASTASVTVDYQPLDAASTAPSFSQSWGLYPDATTPATVYVDLRFSGTTYSTASQVLSSTTPVPVGKTVTSGENTAIGSGQLSRVAPSVVGRFA